VQIICGRFPILNGQAITQVCRGRKPQLVNTFDITQLEGQPGRTAADQLVWQSVFYRMKTCEAAYLNFARWNIDPTHNPCVR